MRIGANLEPYRPQRQQPVRAPPAGWMRPSKVSVSVCLHSLGRPPGGRSIRSDSIESKRPPAQCGASSPIGHLLSSPLAVVVRLSAGPIESPVAKRVLLGSAPRAAAAATSSCDGEKPRRQTTGPLVAGAVAVVVFLEHDRRQLGALNDPPRRRANRTAGR